jgi:HD superfamily phosphohydrolase YqeK
MIQSGTIGVGWTESRDLRELKGWLTEQFGNFVEFAHAMRTANFSYQLAKQLAFSDRECVLTAAAGFLHDLGKEYPTLVRYYQGAARAASWTTTPARLTRLNLCHAGRGPYQLGKYSLGSYEAARDAAAHVQLHHHTPLKKQPRNNHEQLVHVVMVADGFDVMTCQDPKERPHRQANGLSVLNPQQAAEETWKDAKSRWLEETTARVFITKVLELDLNTTGKLILV